MEPSNFIGSITLVLLLSRDPAILHCMKHPRLRIAHSRISWKHTDGRNHGDCVLQKLPDTGLASLFSTLCFRNDVYNFPEVAAIHECEIERRLGLGGDDDPHVQLPAG